MKRFVLAILMVFIFMGQSFASEFNLRKCDRLESVNSRVDSIEIIDGNEILNMVARDGSTASIIRTRDPRIEKYKENPDAGRVIDVDKEFFTYDFLRCVFNFEGQKKTYTGLFFVNKRPLKAAPKREKFSYRGKVYTFSEQGMLWYGIEHKGKDVLLGAAFEFSGTQTDACMRDSDENGTIVTITGEKSGDQVNVKSVRCSK